MKKVKIGVIGTGIAGKELHYPAMKKLSDKFEIVVACNHSEEKLKDYCRLSGVKYSTLDYREVLRNPEIEAVILALPIHLNYKITKEALENGKHVFVEKPIACNLQEAKKMLALGKQHPRMKIMVAENFHYRPLYKRIKQIIRQGRIGKPYSMLWDALQEVDKGSKYATPWRLAGKHVGGFIADGGVHFIAAIRSLFGELKVLSAYSNCINRRIGEIDTISIQYRTKQGIDGVLNMYYSAKGIYVHQMTIMGNKGTIIVSGNKISLRLSNTPEINEEVADDGGFVNEFTNFYNAIRKGEKITSDLKSGFADFNTLMDAIEMAG
jgi:predicted dehydrogenase